MTLAEQINEIFTQAYAPYELPGFKYEPRSESEMPQFEDKRLGILAYQVELRRREDIHAGATLAGREIYANLIEMLKTEKGVHIESLLAVIGSVGGFWSMRAIMQGLNAVLESGVVKGDTALAVAGEALSIYLCTTNSGEGYMFGDKIAREFCSFYMTAAKSSEAPFDVLQPLSARASSTCGSPEYWATPFDDKVGKSPREISEIFRERFYNIFELYCRYPQDRMLAFAIAAQLAVEQAAKIIEKETALSLLAEYGWRTSHFVG
ncbi:MAG: hypothetical protein K2J77_12360 [Oscillospiraceae bacterium]|nr:hypothetical protein [Oscillospiraceae bacterium]